MTRSIRTLMLSALALGLLPLTVSAQVTADAQTTSAVQAVTEMAATEAPADTAEEADNPLVQFPNQRPPDQRGLNTFEPPKTEARLSGTLPKLRVGGAFAQQFQALDHSNTAEALMVDDVNVNQLIDIGSGFNLATANLYVNALLTDGVQVNLETYLSSRHHAEAWVKGGYLQVDAMTFLGSDAVDQVMDYVTLKLGHFEVNYGDAHFRRSDNGNAFYNPFIGNNIMDAFTTEIGGELYVRHAGALAMLGITGGEIKGDVTNPDGRSFSVLGKLGLDRQVTDDLRLRLTGSAYHNGNAGRNTLYGGDRGGSRYYLVLENTGARTSSNFTSGRINPDFTEAVTSVMVNPFVKFRGLELFGTLERTTGHSGFEAESIDRVWTQLAVDALYRFLPREQAYLGVRYNTVSGELPGAFDAEEGQITEAGPEVSIDRYEVAGGWFPTRNLLLKVAYVNQQYNDFPALDIRSGGEFDGFMVEGVLSF
ncbi:MAG: hypothetical protein R3181_08035 [Rubricoccaceae bacterium]|nr:hypothetical protein [Rubricoccaceae bacterium]